MAVEAWPKAEPAHKKNKNKKTFMSKQLYTRPTAETVDIQPGNGLAANSTGGKYTLQVDNSGVDSNGDGGATEGNPDEIDSKKNTFETWDW